MNQSEKPKQETKRGGRLCDECEDLYTKAVTCLQEDSVDKVNTGYDKLVELMQTQHKSQRHETLLNKSVVAIAQKLGKSQTPGLLDFIL